MNKNIILIGYMGSGKSTVARELQNKTGMELLDTDEMIVKEQGRSINEIFAQEGEAAFRDMETDLLKRLTGFCGRKGYIISTGGGMPVRGENRTLLKDLGTVFFLKADTETILERVKADKNRPLLQAPDRKERIHDMLAYRTPFYEAAADKVVITDHKTMDGVVSEIINILDHIV